MHKIFIYDDDINPILIQKLPDDPYRVIKRSRSSEGFIVRGVMSK